MGLNLRGLLNPAALTLGDLQGERLAVDAYGLFYQYLTMLRDGQGNVLRDEHGNTTSHLVGLVARTEELMAAGITPVYVLDGPPHPLKLATLAKRNEQKKKASDLLEQARADGDTALIRKSAAATASVSRQEAENAETLLRVCGLPVVRAPQDAEAQCAAMAAAGLVHAAASQDYDTLVYGAPRTLRNLTTSKRELEEVLLAAFLIEHGLDREALVDLAILVGNDFYPGVHGVGAKGALRLLRRHGNLETVLHRAESGKKAENAAERRVHDAHQELSSPIMQEIRQMFLRPPADLGPKLEVQAPDAAAIHERLVEIHGMSKTRADRFAVTLIEHHQRLDAAGRNPRMERPLQSFQ
jgi:flap endonuclease-1